MAAAVNKKRTHHKDADERSTWGFLFKHEAQENELREGGFFNQLVEENQAPTKRFRFSLLFQKKFSLWSLAATVLFLAFAGTLGIIVLKMWIPQDLDDIEGYGDNEPMRDLRTVISNANGEEVSITEAELNRYLRSTCRMNQTGIFSIITHCQGVAVRLHDGYAEVIFDRIIGADMHQTTSAYLTCTQANEQGHPELKFEFKDGKPLLGHIPVGGTIGLVRMPQRHIRMLKPALESLIKCYPDLLDLIEHYHYCPVFSGGASPHLKLIPYSPS